MTVTLMRHYKVKYTWKAQYTPSAFQEALKEYDEAEVWDQHVQLPLNYQRVVISSLKRTYETLRLALEECKYDSTPLLNEVPIAASTNSQKAYNVNVFNLKARLQWLFNDVRQPETRKMTVKRANDFIDQNLCEDANYLVIGHGFFLRVLSRQLIKRRFKGKAVTYLKNGEYYVYNMPGIEAGYA